MSSSPSKSTEETNKVSQTSRHATADQQPLFTDLWSKTQGVINAQQPDNFVAGPSDASRMGIENLLAAAPGASANAGSLRDIAGKVASGYFLDPANDPTFAASADAAIRPITQQLTEKVLPSIVDQSIRNGGVGGGPGAYGGARQDIQQNQAVRDWTQAAGDITAKLAATSRANGMNLIPQAGAIDTAATTAALAPGNIQSAAGGASTALDQLILNNQIAKWLGPLQALTPAAQIAGVGNFYDGMENTNSTTTKTTPAPSMATQWLQGLTGVAGLAGSFMGMPGLGAGLSGLGGLMGGFAGGSPSFIPGSTPEWSADGSRRIANF